MCYYEIIFKHFFGNIQGALNTMAFFILILIQIHRGVKLRDNFLRVLQKVSSNTKNVPISESFLFYTRVGNFLRVAF